jgi:peptide/nickel transport system substrate-binding protein
MKKLLALGLIILIALEFSGCISISENDGFDENYELVIGVCAGPYGFHPWMNSYDVDTMSINSNIFNGLVEFDNLFRINPALAESWNNPNNLTWRFNLRKNVKFHNGNDFTAKDVKYTIDLIQQDNNSPLRELLTSVSNVSIINNHTVDIITTKPCPILLNKLVDIYIVSKKYQKEIDYEWPIGTGPYKLKQYIEEKNITLERFDKYWGGKPSIKRVIFEILCESEERKDALINGDVDIAGVHPDHFMEIYNETGLDVKTISPPTVFYLSFDFREYNSSYRYGEKNPVSDVRVRKAIYHAIDIDYLIEEKLNGFGGAASQFVSPLIFGYNPNIKRAPYDINLARKYLNDSGYENGFKIDIDCTDSNSSQEFFIAIAEMLEEINITVNLNPLPGSELYHKLFVKNSTLFFMGWLTATTDGGEIFDFILNSVDEKNSTGLYNYGYYSNPQVDTIGNQVSSMMDVQERLSLMQDGFRIAMEDIAWIPLYIPQRIYGCRENIEWIPYAGMGYNVLDIKCKC